MTVGINVVDTIPPATTDDAPQKAVNHDIAVHLEATDSGSGVAATYFNVDGGAQQTGNSITLTTEGNHTLVYWSVDLAGNVEQPHTVTVKIDKTAPVTVASVIPAVPNGSNGWYVHAVTVSLSAFRKSLGCSQNGIQPGRRQHMAKLHGAGNIQSGQQVYGELPFDG